MRFQSVGVTQPKEHLFDLKCVVSTQVSTNGFVLKALNFVRVPSLVFDVDSLLADGAELAALGDEHHDERYGTAREEPES